jgi:hypothetical protein
MIMLKIEHPVPSFEQWKQAFDSDPVGRQRSGVRRYRILRPVDDPRYTIIELEFDDIEHAQAMLAALQQLWSRVEGSVMTNPQYRIVELVEAVSY